MSKVKETEKQALAAALVLLEGAASLARQLGISRQAVHSWKRAPSDYCPTIERLTLRRVTCEQLREDVEWSVIRQKTRRRPAPETNEPIAEGQAS